ncbi:MAG: ABC transporter ATP-binding protein [Oscillospiraceae bacterium]|jgi:ABC-2 type transport system ATP-binding protein|nr:ABC transporter ATP-binding protein [Oscillospiraceae bacterium]
MIEVTELTKRYGKQRGVTDISFTVGEGEIVGFLGPNGAGKTTAMNVITGYLAPTSGSVYVAGVNMLENPVSAKRNIGYLPEQPPLYHDMKVAEYLDFVYDLKGVTELPRRRHIDDVCEMADIQDVRHRLLRNLSKGYRQRVGLAQALLGDPCVLILDEPTSGLDPKQIMDMRKVIKDLGQSHTVMLSTHILQEVSAVCERVLVISEGKIVADGSPADLAGSMAGERKLVVRVAGPRDNVLSLLKSRDGVKKAEPIGEVEERSCDFLVESLPNMDVRKPLFSALAAAGWPILMLRPETVSLEDVFISLTEKKEVQ